MNACWRLYLFSLHITPLHYTHTHTYTCDLFPFWSFVSFHLSSLQPAGLSNELVCLFCLLSLCFPFLSFLFFLIILFYYQAFVHSLHTHTLVYQVCLTPTRTTRRRAHLRVANCRVCGAKLCCQPGKPYFAVVFVCSTWLNHCIPFHTRHRYVRARPNVYAVVANL